MIGSDDEGGWLDAGEDVTGIGSSLLSSADTIVFGVLILAVLGIVLDVVEDIPGVDVDVTDALGTGFDVLGDLLGAVVNAWSDVL